MEKETGGNAFPAEFNDGMTLRDYFAAKAMPALIVVVHDNRVEYHWFAKEAYKYADAMLEARK